MDKLTNILAVVGFTTIMIDTQIVSDEYAANWGIEADIQQGHIRRAIITATKPLP